jgi:hypothetical protein
LVVFSSLAREDGFLEAVADAPPDRAEPAKAAPGRRPSLPKLTVVAAWSAWQADGTASSGTVFLQNVSSWTEGTAAQLLRRRWPVGARRPSSPEVQERLRDHMALAARGGSSTYLEALEWARDGVNRELCLAQADDGGAPARS